MKTSEILKKARGFIAKGWTQNTLYQRKGNVHCYCALGAIDRATSGNVNADAATWTEYIEGRDARRTLERAIARLTKKSRNHVDVAPWNDREGRTQEDVLRVFDLAIEIAEKDETRAGV